jgi:tetratricopeptide (TPR) repeat protein
MKPATGEASLGIRDRLSKTDPGNAGWQRDVSVSHNRIGDVLRAQGNLPAALDVFKTSLSIAERLSKSDPGNAGWQRDLSVSHSKIGDVLRDQGNLLAALDAFKASLSIAERLSKSAEPFEETRRRQSYCSSTVWARRFCDQQEMSLHVATGLSLP